MDFKRIVNKLVITKNSKQNADPLGKNLRIDEYHRQDDGRSMSKEYP
jgi:hypothetical protein